MLQAIELFQQAVALDPKFSKAWSGLAVTYSLMPVYGATISAAEGSEKTLQYANTAIALDAGNAEAWVARGRVEGEQNLDLEVGCLHHLGIAGRNVVGFELTAEPQRDLTAEDAAARLRALGETHYRTT
jgi:tetratricopeptide (TPR) repeat protein